MNEENSEKGKKMPDKKLLLKKGVLAIALISFLIIFLVLKSDSSLDSPEQFVISQKTDSLERNYFDLVVSRIPMEVQVFDVEQEKTNITLGVDVSKDRLHFGIVPAPSPARKVLTLENKRDNPVKFVISAYGNISKYVMPEYNNFILNPYEQKNVTINFIGLDKTANLSGELDVLVKIPTSDVSKAFLRIV